MRCAADAGVKRTTPAALAAPPKITLLQTGVSATSYRQVFFYGGAEGVAARLASVLAERFPGFRVAGFETPPFRELMPEEGAATDTEKVSDTFSRDVSGGYRRVVSHILEEKVSDTFSVFRDS